MQKSKSNTVLSKDYSWMEHFSKSVIINDNAWRVGENFDMELIFQYNLRYNFHFLHQFLLPQGGAVARSHILIVGVPQIKINFLWATMAQMVERVVQ